MKSRFIIMTGIVLALVSAPSFAEQATTRPKIVFDSIVKSAGPQKTAQLFVKNSEPVGPGAHVDIITSDDPAHALVVDAVVEAARWKIKSFSMPSYPADGFVTMTLSQAQWEGFRSKG